ncbi:MAG TPA: hypothetical protein VJC05_00235 [Candidatus Andersenbacteria bacterium]|nr:hypothetical protein [Candidatus Andersenbacteria bacterium]
MFEANPFEQIKRDLKRLVDDVAELRGNLSRQSTASLSSLQDDAKAGLRKAEEYTRSKPWAATGIAAAIGATLALLLTHRKHRD